MPCGSASPRCYAGVKAEGTVDELRSNVREMRTRYANQSETSVVRVTIMACMVRRFSTFAIG